MSSDDAIHIDKEGNDISFDKDTDKYKDKDKLNASTLQIHFCSLPAAQKYFIYLCFALSPTDPILLASF